MTTTVAGDSRLAGQEYCFSLERLGELNRSPIPLLSARLSTACPSFGKTASEIDDPGALVSEISAHCSGEDGFIQSSMPLQEIVFRTLLLNGGGPMSLFDLHNELTERWSSPVRPITLTMSGLARVLDSDVFYGFAALPMEMPETDDADLPMLTLGHGGGSGAAAGTLQNVGVEDDEDGEPYDDDGADDLYDDDDDEDFDED